MKQCIVGRCWADKHLQLSSAGVFQSHTIIEKKAVIENRNVRVDYIEKSMEFKLDKKGDPEKWKIDKIKQC